MANYGELLDNDYDPNKDMVYPLFVEYFNNPLMSKLKDTEQNSIYISRIHSLLGIEHRYLIVFVFKDRIPLGTQINLSKLPPWISLQTRTLQDEHQVPFHNYIPRRLNGLNQKIALTHKDENQYVYNVDQLPLIITLLPKTGGSMEYSNSGQVVNALETYQTIVTFKN